MKLSYYRFVILLLSICISHNECKGATATNRARMYFNVGSVDFDLYGNESPLHVDNFLGYVNNSAYDRTWIHRSFCCGNLFFLQGGEYYLPHAEDIAPDEHSVVSGDTVENEYDENNQLTNSPGTLSAARTSDLDSARNGWFINTSDNSTQFPDYTIFGETTRGFNIVQGISSLPIGNSYLSSYGYNTAPVFNNYYVYLIQVVERSIFDGDYNLNNAVDSGDLGIWASDFGRMIIAGPDINHDSEINSGDIAAWAAGFGNFSGIGDSENFADFEEGDANRDGAVNGADYLSILRLYGSTTDVSADSNGDYRINGADYLEWARNYGNSIVVSSVTAIPEPSSIALIGACLFLSALHFRH